MVVWVGKADTLKQARKALIEIFRAPTVMPQAKYQIRSTTSKAVYISKYRN